MSQDVIHGLVVYAGEAHAKEPAYVIEAGSIQELRGLGEIHKLPGCTPREPGYVLVRDEPVPLLDLRVLCPALSPSEQAVVVVVHHEGKLMGLIVGALDDMHHFPASEARNPGDAGVSLPWVKHLLKTSKEEIALVLDIPYMMAHKSSL